MLPSIIMAGRDHNIDVPCGDYFFLCPYTKGSKLQTSVGWVPTLASKNCQLQFCLVRT